jgi:hypothetical protein
MVITIQKLDHLALGNKLTIPKLDQSGIRMVNLCLFQVPGICDSKLLLKLIFMLNLNLKFDFKQELSIPAQPPLSNIFILV